MLFNDNTPHVLVEVCIGSVADANAAVAAGADRLELCAALELGGLTPSWGSAQRVLEISSVPVVVMLRPRAGGFRYDHDEFAAMLRDGERFLQLGASGLVFGILDASGCVDRTRSREIVQLAGSRQSVFHRAFDFIGDQPTAIDALADIGCTRILTSGGRPTAEDGAAAIRGLVSYAAGRIEVMAGGRISAETIAQLVRQTGCQQLHLGAATPRSDDSVAGRADINLCDGRFLRGLAHRVVSGQAVSAAVAALQRARLR